MNEALVARFCLNYDCDKNDEINICDVDVKVYSAVYAYTHDALPSAFWVQWHSHKFLWEVGEMNILYINSSK